MGGGTGAVLPGGRWDLCRVRVWKSGGGPAARNCLRIAVPCGVNARFRAADFDSARTGKTGWRQAKPSGDSVQEDCTDGRERGQGGHQGNSMRGGHHAGCCAALVSGHLVAETGDMAGKQRFHSFPILRATEPSSASITEASKLHCCTGIAFFTNLVLHAHFFSPSADRASSRLIPHACVVLLP